MTTKVSMRLSQVQVREQDDGSGNLVYKHEPIAESDSDEDVTSFGSELDNEDSEDSLSITSEEASSPMLRGKKKKAKAKPM
jgi:hypothetical protein